MVVRGTVPVMLGSTLSEGEPPPDLVATVAIDLHKERGCKLRYCTQCITSGIERPTLASIYKYVEVYWRDDK